MCGTTPFFPRQLTRPRQGSDVLLFSRTLADGRSVCPVILCELIHLLYMGEGGHTRTHAPGVPKAYEARAWEWDGGVYPGYTRLIHEHLIATLLHTKDALVPPEKLLM